MVILRAKVGRLSFKSKLGYCPDGFTGRYRFTGILKNVSKQILSKPIVKTVRLTNDNYLYNQGALYETGERFDVSRHLKSRSRVLKPGSQMKVPFVVCLRQRKKFALSVDVQAAVGRAKTRH